MPVLEKILGSPEKWTTDRDGSMFMSDYFTVRTAHSCGDPERPNE